MIQAVTYHTFYFFFSSRRRHTRWTGDWSSDVCSSDLAISDKESFLTARELLNKEGILGGSSTGTLLAAALRYCREQREHKRSEERRVGKECRYRRTPDH